MKQMNFTRISFLALVITSLIVVSFFSVQYVETYAIIANLSLSIDDVALSYLNHNISSFVVTVTLVNPSKFLSLSLKYVSIQPALNGEQLLYLRRTLYFEREISPDDTFQIVFDFQSLEKQDVMIIESANVQNNWHWDLKIAVYVQVLFKEALLDRSQSHVGVNVFGD